MYRFLPFVLVFCLLPLGVATEAEAQDLTPRVLSASRVNTSQPMRTMPIPPSPHRATPPTVIPNKFHDFTKGRAAEERPGFVDPVLDAGRGGVGPGTVLQSFDGVSEDDNAAVAQVVVPPDPNGDVGPNHYFQSVNLAARIFDKSGNLLLGPVPNNFFWQGLGGRCETENDGDPIVLYDHLADRWVIMQFQISVGDDLCLAVSTTPDPLGSYHQYEFDFSAFPDYPKMGVWTDGYYVTTREFNFGYQGQDAVVFEREAMLQGLPAEMVSFRIPGGSSIDGYLPADLDGPAPPSGTPGLFVGGPVTSPQRLNIYGLDVNWNNPGASTFTLLNSLVPASYDRNFGNIAQPGTSSTLATLSFTLMHRVQYRNFGNRQTLVLNHSVDAGGDQAGVRWYELRNGAGNTGSGWSIYQQGTYAPNDGLERWMGSAALNGNGDLGLAYSVSGSSLFPSIRFTGQTADQSGSGVMNVDETTILTGTGSQINSFSRWGDYSMLAVDPVDDQTFWFTSEYYQTTTSFDFKTRIAEFRLPSTGSVELTATNTTSLTVPPGGSVSFDYTVANGTAASVTGDLFYTATPGGVSGTIASGTLPAGQSVNGSYTQNIPASAPAGAYTYTLRIGQFPGTTVDSQAFTINVTPTGEASSSGTGDWTVTGATPWSADDLVARSEASLPNEATLNAAYPNPFVAATTLSFALPTATDVTLEVLDVLGRRVALLAEGEWEAGSHTVGFDASSLPSGAYLVRLATDTGAQTQRITLLR